MNGPKKGARKFLCAALSFLMCCPPSAALAFGRQKRTNTNNNNGNDKVTICHLPPGNPENAQTITISASALNTHLEQHGDYLGPCETGPGDIEVCDPPIENPTNCNSTFVHKKEVGAYIKKGGYVGKCQNEKVRICHLPPGNPGNAQSIEISRYALQSHLDHGDILGDCPTSPQNGHCPGDENEDGCVICHIPRGESTFGQTMTICCGSLKGHLDHGDYLGECVPPGDDDDQDPEKILICHIPPGNPTHPVSIYISVNALNAHVQHGDQLGSCSQTQPVCGNGIVEAAGNEECDDAGQSSRCNADCTLSRCGDGKLNVNSGEVCDDGNVSNNDACLNTCRPATCGDSFVYVGVEQCDTGGETALCNRDCSNARCGDGKWNPTAGEECDDGNNVDGDGCNSTCHREFVCGNGIREGIEECDDGNSNNNDACLNSCLNARCGDTYVRTGVEECDDGNLDNTDGCLNTCKIARCGDNFTQFGVEQCDIGFSDNTTSCLGNCMFGFCGDGYVNFLLEECDDGNKNNTDSCLNTCKNAICGDGFTNPSSEQCDDGNFNNDDDCLNTCQTAYCGDGYVHTGIELCDEGIYNGAGVGHCLADCSGVQTPPSTSSDPGLPPGAIAGIATAGAVVGVGLLAGAGFLVWKALGGAAGVSRFLPFNIGGAAQAGAQAGGQGQP